MSYPLAVVVPTHNRCNALRQCMRDLEQQECKDFEVVVVDDGSTDSTQTWMGEYSKRTPLMLRYFRQQNAGPARARNFALAMVDAPLTILIGDDIFVTPQFTALHMQLHEQRTAENVVGVGLTLWDEQGQELTPFMRWLDQDGMQFNYGELLAGLQPDWKHFYTSNLSVKTSLLRSFPFDESYPYAAMEDIDAACRVEAERGLEMVFLREAVAYHLHPMSFPAACWRMEKVGESTAYFNKRWPGKLPHSPNPRSVRLGKLLHDTPMAVPVIVSLASLSLRISCPNRLMLFVLRMYFQRGYERHMAQSDSSRV